MSRNRTTLSVTSKLVRNVPTNMRDRTLRVKAVSSWRDRSTVPEDSHEYQENDQMMKDYLENLWDCIDLEAAKEAHQDWRVSVGANIETNDEEVIELGAFLGLFRALLQEARNREAADAESGEEASVQIEVVREFVKQATEDLMIDIAKNYGNQVNKVAVHDRLLNKVYQSESESSE